MGDENPIRTLGDCSRPSHEGYRNTIKILEGNNVVPLRFDTIRDLISSSHLSSPLYQVQEKNILIMEYLVKISKKARILELKRRNMKITVLTSYTPYPSRKIRRICACTSLNTTKEQGSIRPHDEHDIEEGNELRQIKHKEDNKNDEQPNKRDLAEKKSTKLVKYRSSGILLIMEYLVKISKKARILELKRRNMKITVLTSYTLYPSRKIRRICACTSLKTTKEQGSIRRIQRILYAVFKLWRSIRTSSISFYLPRKKVNNGRNVKRINDEGKREHEEMKAFICEFRTTNEILFKERNNSLSELRFEVQELLNVINNTPMTNCKIKGVTTRGGKTTTHDVQTNNTNVHAEEPLVVNHDKLVESNEVLDKDQPQTSNEPVIQPSSELQTPSIPFPRRLRKEKEEAQQRKLLENLKKLHINLPFTEALAQMPKYAKFLKGLLTNKAKLKEACTITMNERCSAVLLNKLPSKEKDPGSFTIPWDIGQLHINKALADLGASISLMPYTMYGKLGLGEPKTTRMSLELADRLIQYPREIIENVLIKVDKFTLPIDFVILDMPEDSRVPIILGRQFLATTRAMIYMFNKKIAPRVGDDEVIFDVDQSIKRPPTEDDECYVFDDLDDTINAEAQELLANDKSDSFLLKGLEKLINQSDLESCECFESKADDDSDPRKPIWRIDFVNMPYSVAQEIARPDNVESEHLYSASTNEIDEKKPELKNLPHHLEYAYLHGDNSCPIIISSKLSEKEKMLLLQVLEKLKGAIAWKMRLNPKVQDVVKNEIIKLLDFGLIYPISDSSWVSHIHVVPKKGGMTVVLNDNNELIPSRTITGWRVCIDYRKLNDATRKDHFPLPFIDQMLEHLYGNEYYCFLDGFSGFFQISIGPEDQEKTTFTCPYGTFSYQRMPFGLCNVPATFQIRMTTIFHDMVEDFMEVFMDDFSVFNNSFNCYLANLDRMLARCEETNLVLNWEKCHFMVKEGIVLGQKILGTGIKVDRAKIDVIAKLQYPKNVKGVRSFLGHAGFYRRFIKDFLMISKPMTQLLMKDAKFDSDDCKKAFTILKEKLTTTPIMISPDWNAPFELMCDASDFAVGDVLGQRIDGKFKPVYYASKTLNNA
ncbi:putative nucleotidyltransferase, ribonuclease H [Tanacetum coccineum]